MRRRPGYISLVVKDAGDRRHAAARDDLADEGHASPQFILLAAPDVEAQVDLVKIAVQRNRDTKHLHGKKAKPDQADETPSLPQIELCSPWNQAIEQCRINLVVEHEHVAQLGGEERAGWVCGLGIVVRHIVNVFSLV